jgi:hypothetical protein
MLTEELYNEIFSELLQESVTQNSILEAMKNRYVCNITYNDETAGAATGTRKVEFFCYGRSHHGHDVVRAWQDSGDSKTPNGKLNNPDPLKKISGWRFFRVDRITHVEFLENERFSGNRPKFNADDKHMEEIYHSVDGSTPVSSNNSRTSAAPVSQNGEVDTRVNNQSNTQQKPTASSLGSSIKSTVKSGVNNMKSKLGGLLDRMKNRNKPDKPKRNIYESFILAEAEAVPISDFNVTKEKKTTSYEFKIDVAGIEIAVSLAYDRDNLVYHLLFWRADVSSNDMYLATNKGLKVGFIILETIFQECFRIIQNSEDMAEYLHFSAIKDEKDSNEMETRRKRLYTFFLDKKGYKWESSGNDVYIDLSQVNDKKEELSTEPELSEGEIFINKILQDCL